MASHEPARAAELAFDNVVITHELDVRRSRRPDYRGEAATLRQLVEQMAEDPADLPRRIGEAARDLCRAGSAGITLVDHAAEAGPMRWQTAVGANGHRPLPPGLIPAPTSASFARVLLLDRADRCFDAHPATTGREHLLAPLQASGEVVGALWAASHGRRPHFDAEDARQLASLARFTAAAWRVIRLREPRADGASAPPETGEVVQTEALFRRLVSVQEEERRRIAREIHDQLGQQVTALRIHLDSVQASVGNEPDLREVTARMQQIAEEIDVSVDFITWELRPSSLDHLGLPAALGDLVRGWSERFGVPAEYETSGTDGLRLPADVETNLYRVAQEALHNVHKHAGATLVTVFLERRDDEMVLVIEDDGRGFATGDVARRSAPGRLGLVGMRERVALIGGTLDLETSPGRGTSVFVRVPVAIEASRDRRA